MTRSKCTTDFPVRRSKLGDGLGSPSYIFISISLLIVAVASSCAVSVSAEERPNILLIVSEDNGPELGCYGDPFVKTPVLDKLAEEGVRFHNAYVPQAGCSQSRATLLTGLYPHQNGQIGLATWKFRMYHEDTPNLVRSLRRAGYRTGIIGKLHVNPASAFPFDVKKIPSSNFSRKKLADYAKHAEAFFNTGDKPFFLSVNYPDAHRPFIKQACGLPTDPLTGDDVKPLAYFGLDTPELRSETANYYNCMSRLDSLIGDLLDSLSRSGKSDNTLVIYMGDHGADMLRGKRTSYEGGVRVPLIIRWPENAKAKQIRNELVSTLDLMPSLLAVSGAAPVPDLPGLSLIPLLRGEKPRTTDFTIKRFFAGLPKTIESAPAHIRDSYHDMRSPPEFELYDLQADPHEFRNLANDADHAATLKDLKTNLTNWRNRTSDPLLNAENLKRLKSEIDACTVDGIANKARLNLTYPDYFFAKKK